MLRVGVLTLVTVIAAACAAPVRQVETGTAATTAAAESTNADAPPPVSATGAIWPPRMPAAGKFEEVPLGKWADYEESYLDAATIKERVALVARGSEAITIETTTETRPGDRTVFATMFASASSAGWRVTRHILQVRARAPSAAGGGVARNIFQGADDDPMESPAIGPAQQPYPRADPNKLVGSEMVSVKAGLFKANHYRYRTAYGETVDYWVDESVAPIGLIKLQAEQKQLTSFRAGFK